MRNFILPKQRFWRMCLFSVLLGVLMTLAVAEDRSPLLERQLIGFYSGLYIESTFAFLFALLPFFLIVIMVSDVIERDFSLISCYCFTRMKRREQWYCYKLLSVALLSLIGVLGYRLAGYATLQLFSPEKWPVWQATALPNVHAFLFAWLFVLCLAVAINVFSLLCSVKWLVIGGFLLCAGCSVWAELQLKAAASLWWLNPALHFSLLAHPAVGYRLGEGIEYLYIPQLAYWKSYLFFGIVCISFVVAGYFLIKKIDPGLIKEDG